MLNTPGYVTASRRTSSSMEAELADLKALMELKKMYSWKDDDPLFLKRQGDIMKKHAKLSKGIQKKKGGTALCKPRIHSWATVSTVKVKDFKDVHSKLSVISEGIWVADRWSRGGVLNYMDEPACPWRRRMTNDGQAFARIIKYSKGFAIQKGKLAGFLDLLDNDEDSGEESVENDEDDDEEEAAQPAKPQPAKKAAASSKKKAEQEKPQAPQPTPEVGEPKGKRQRKETKRYA